MSLLAAFLEELNGLRVQAPNPSRGVDTPAFRTLVLNADDCDCQCRCDCRCDCDCQCKCGNDCDCKCDCVCQCKCDCGLVMARSDETRAKNEAYAEALRTRFAAVMLVNRGESIDRVAEAYKLKPADLQSWVSGFQVCGPSALHVTDSAL
jgi:hypothetical protein